MRIKLKGLITAERLATALDAASVKFGDHFGGFYGASLYLNCFSPDGLPVGLADSDGKETMLTFGVPDGELEKPVMTKEGALIKQSREQQAKEEIERQEAERTRIRENEERRLEEERQKNEKNAATIRALNALTSQALIQHPDDFVERLNAVIRAAWDELKPVFPHGKDKDQPRPIPVFKHNNGVLQLYRNVTATLHRKVKNPVYPKTRWRDDFDHYWAHPAWLEAEKSLFAVMVHEQDLLRGLNSEPAQ